MRGGNGMSTGLQIKIDTTKMSAVAQAVNNQMAVISSCFDNIREQYSELRGNYWEGMSAEAYFDNMKKLCNEQPLPGSVSAGSIVKALGEYVLNLNKAASEFNATERNLDAKHKALPIDIFGV
jgi:WXG100 family type VII secretion target